MISVIIAAFNEEHTLPKCIDSVFKQLSNYSNSEVIVVIDGSTDNTLSVARRMQNIYSNMILITQSERKGKASAIRLGKKSARGDLLILTDADVIWEDNALEHLISHFAISNVGLACARVKPVSYGSKFFSLLNRIHCDIWHKVRISAMKKKHLLRPAGHLYAIRSSLFPELPQFLINDDGFIGLYVAQSGYQLIYDPRSIVLIYCPRNFFDYIRQKTRTNLGRIQLHHFYPGEITRANNIFLQESIKHVFSLTPKFISIAIFHLMLLILCRLFALCKFRAVGAEVYSKWPIIRSSKWSPISKK